MTAPTRGDIRSSASTDPVRVAARAYRVAAILLNGKVPEWTNGAVSKTVDVARHPWVRIPSLPPSSCGNSGRRWRGRPAAGRDF
jgi:hypothetical protein